MIPFVCSLRMGKSIYGIELRTVVISSGGEDEPEGGVGGFLSDRVVMDFVISVVMWVCTHIQLIELYI